MQTKVPRIVLRHARKHLSCSNTRHTRRLALTFVGLAALGLRPAMGADQYWDGTDTNDTASVNSGQGGTGTWTASGTNWYNGAATAGNDNAAWLDGNNAVFGGTAGTVTISGAPGPTVGGLRFDVDNYIIAMSGATNLNLTASATIPIATGANNATISARLAGTTVTINKTGTGTLTLSPTTNNLNTGTFNLTNGEVDLNGASAFISISSTALNVGDGTDAVGSAVLKLTGTSSTNAIADAATLTLASDGTFDLNGRTETIGNLSTMTGGSITTAGAAGGKLVLNSTATTTVTGASTISSALQLSTTTAARTRTFAVTNASDSLSITGAISEASASQAVTLLKTGAGTLYLINNGNSWTGNTSLTNGTTVASTNAASIPTTTFLAINNQGVLATNGTFNRTLGTSGAGKLTLLGSSAPGGGFAAYGGNLVVNLGNPDSVGAPLKWNGTTGLLGGSLNLGSIVATDVVDFQNALDLNGASRVIKVDDNPNTANDSARVSGAISNSVAGNFGLTKTGGGTLEISGGASFAGALTNGATADRLGTLNITTNAFSAGSLDNWGALKVTSQLVTTGNATQEAGSKISIDGSAGNALPMFKIGGAFVMIADPTVPNALLTIGGTPLPDGYNGINPANTEILSIKGANAVSAIPQVLVGGVTDAVGSIAVRTGAVVDVVNGGYLQTGDRVANHPAGRTTIGDASGAGIAAMIVDGGTGGTVASNNGSKADLYGQLFVAAGTNAAATVQGVVEVINGGSLHVSGAVFDGFSSGTATGNSGSILVKDSTLTTDDLPSSHAVTPGGSVEVAQGQNSSGTVTGQLIITGSTAIWNSKQQGTSTTDTGPSVGSAIGVGHTAVSGTGASSGKIVVDDHATVNSNFVANQISIGNTNTNNFGEIDIQNDATWNHLGGSAAPQGGTVTVGPHGIFKITAGGEFLNTGGDNFLITSGNTSGGSMTVDGQGVSRSTLQTPVVLVSNGDFTYESGSHTSVVTGVVGGKLTVSNNGLVNATSLSTDSAVQSLATLELDSGGEFKMASGHTLLLSGKLQGNGGKITGNVSSTGANIAPGNSPGTMEITGNLTQDSASSFTVEIGGTTPATSLLTANAYDNLLVDDTATIGGTLSVSKFGGFTFASAPLATYSILDSAHPILGAYSNVASGGTLTIGGETVYVFYGAGSIFNPDDVVLSTFNSVPEPASFALLGLGGVMILSRKRREAR